MSFHYFIVCFNPYNGGLEYDDVLHLQDQAEYNERIVERVQKGFGVLRKVDLPAKDGHPCELCIMIMRGKME